MVVFGPASDVTGPFGARAEVGAARTGIANRDGAGANTPACENTGWRRLGQGPGKCRKSQEMVHRVV